MKQTTVISVSIDSIVEKITACKSMIDALEDEILAILRCEGQDVILARQRAQPTCTAGAPHPSTPQFGKESIGFNCLRRQLSPRQMQVLQLLRNRLTSREIADGLGIRCSTVGRIRQVLYTRLGVHSAAQALVAANRLGVLQEEGRPVQSREHTAKDPAAQKHRPRAFERIRAAKLKQHRNGDGAHLGYLLPAH